MVRFSNYLWVLCFLGWCTESVAQASTVSELPTIEAFTQEMDEEAGFFTCYYDVRSGQMFLRVDSWGEEFLYVNALAAGVGSNDIGLDRGQLGQDRVVWFQRIGPKVLLTQRNYRYRANSENPDERRAVEEAFAQSVLGGFKIAAETGEAILIDITDFLLRDAHGVAARLSAMNEGTYAPDLNRSALYLPMTRNFPQNTEFESIITFSGKPAGPHLPTVVPTPEAISVRMHHSFVQLPDDAYSPRMLDPRSGYMSIGYYDYATPIDAPLEKRFILRHRLEKRNPTNRTSEAIEPIVYYVDRGAPEPIRSALIEGASWWNQAFEAAGYQDAFQVKLLPEDAHPLDVRYNVIQWVHRSTRGWSYGASVHDPRTGEIIKGHVSLGSLRVRQDYLIAQGLLKPFETGQPASPKMLEMALARLRQLSAHEVGHTLGLMHNFAASPHDRASVMDYPHPYIELAARGSIHMEDAYDVGIGEWDKLAIRYGYEDFPGGTDESKALWEIVAEGIDEGLEYLTDADARPAGSSHPAAHLWDNGADAAEELNRLLSLRAEALENFGLHNIPEGAPLARLEEVLVPLYFGHRYQVEAVAKSIGGMAYTFSLRGDNQEATRIIPADQQMAALEALLGSLEPEVLAIPESTLQLIPPRAPGLMRGRENLPLRTRVTLDPLAAASALADHTFNLLLHAERAARLVEFHARDPRMPGLQEVLDRTMEQLMINSTNPYHQSIQWEVRDRLLAHLLKLAANQQAGPQVQAIAWQAVQEFRLRLARDKQAQSQWMIREIDRFSLNPDQWKPDPAPRMPDGSPIGCGL